LHKSLKTTLTPVAHYCNETNIARKHWQHVSLHITSPNLNHDNASGRR
jgi:hypothetical protein